MPESRVYILGAGCSKDCGYPLGPEMKADMEQSIDWEGRKTKRTSKP